MSAGKHTSGRLAWDGKSRIDAVDFRRENDRGYMEGLVALPYSCGVIGGPGYDPTENAEANARRIAASWNACLDVPTEVLEAEQSGGLPWNVGEQLERRSTRTTCWCWPWAA